MSFGDALRALVEERAVVWGFVLAIATTLALTPLVRRLAVHFDLLDKGGDRPRIHRQPIPRIGGLAIAAGIMLPAALLVDLRGATIGIFIGIPLVVAIGLWDDVKGMSASTKLLAVTLVATIPVLGWDMTFKAINLPFVGVIEFGWTAIPLTLLWIALVTNLVNLIDGMDALAAGIVAIAAAAFALLAVSFGRYEVAALAAIVCGATLGFVLGTLSVEGSLKNAATIALAAPLLVMAVPLLDTSFVVAKRLKYGRRPWAPDQNHFYHRFLRIGYSQRRTAAYLHLWALVLTAYAVLLRFVPPRPGGVWDVSNTALAAGCGAAILAGSVWMVYELEILKARHLQALRRRRFVPEHEREEAVEEMLTASTQAVPAPADPPDPASSAAGASPRRA